MAVVAVFIVDHSIFINIVAGVDLALVVIGQLLPHCGWGVQGNGVRGKEDKPCVKWIFEGFLYE